MNEKAMAYSLSDYKKTAYRYYKLLTATGAPHVCADDSVNGSVFQSCNYWRVGNVLDTLIDYMHYAVRTNTISQSEAEQVLKTAYERYLWMLKGTVGERGGSSNGCWYDDFGWWGIAAARAYDPVYQYLFGSQLQHYKNIAMSCWTTMHHGKFDDYHHGCPNAFDKCDQDVFARVKPKFDGGVWQYDIFETKRDAETSGSNPSSPIQLQAYPWDTPVALGPYQMTVVNGLYFTLAVRLCRAGMIDRTAADKVYGFFRNWIFDPSLKNDERLINTFGTPVRAPETYALIRERVSMYANGEPVYNYTTEAAWAGDQGLVMGGMVDYNRTFNIADSNYIAIILLAGVKNKMYETLNGKKILKSWYPDQNFPPFSIDPGDYSSGLGVYMRYLLNGFNHNMQINNLLSTSPAYREPVFNTADACVDGTLPTYNTPLFDNFNYLATLLMACSIWR